MGVRALAIVLVMLVVTAPFGTAMWAPDDTPVDPLAIAPLPADIRDADVLTLLALEMGLRPTRLPIPMAPEGAPLSPVVLALGARAGLPILPQDTAPFDELHPLVAQPTLVLLLALQQAWDLRDAAFADWTAEDFAAAEQALEAGAPLPKALTPDQMETLINAAILLSDTIESVVIPQLKLAAQAGVWPAIAVADPVGVLRIGSSGNDVEIVDRILQIDMQGDDVYHNRPGTGMLLYGRSTGAPVGLSLDLVGNDSYVPDQYQPVSRLPSTGAGYFGIGLLYDLSGSDVYVSGAYTAGSGIAGVGILRDAGGADRYKGSDGVGYGWGGVGVLRDDAGDDQYEAGGTGGGSGEFGGLGLLWDRGGADFFNAYFGHDFWGWGDSDGRGWFVDETASVDTYFHMFPPHTPHPKACNTCTWRAGYEGGRGNDNFGGLAYLLAKQDPWSRAS